MTPDPKNFAKRLRGINRDNALAVPGRKMTTQTIKSKKDKAKCPKRQRKHKLWDGVEDPPERRKGLPRYEDY